MKIDIHTHTKKCKSGDAPTREISPENFCEAILSTEVRIIAITNHNVFDLDQYTADNLQWRTERLGRLRGPDGYLNLAGLFWLEEGSVGIGSSDENDIVFPNSAAPHIGELQVSEAGVSLHVADGVEVFSLLRKSDLAPDDYLDRFHDTGNESVKSID